MFVLGEYIKLLDNKIKHRDEQVENLKRTVQSLKQQIIEFEQASSAMPTSTTREFIEKCCMSNKSLRL